MLIDLFNFGFETISFIESAFDTLFSPLSEVFEKAGATFPPLLNFASDWSIAAFCGLGGLSLFIVYTLLKWVLDIIL